jgi:PAS domain S-box-containing protein
MTLDTNTASIVLMISAVVLCVVGGILLGIRHTLRRTAREIAEPKPRSVESIAPDVINAMPDGVAIIDSTGTYIDANPALCRMTGFSREELVRSKPPYLYWPEDQVEQIVEYMLMAVRGEITEYEVVFQRKDGSRFPTVITPSSFIDSTSGEQYYLSTIKDLSASKSAEERLRHSEKRYRTLYDNTPVIFLSVDPDGLIHAINRFGAEHLGYTAEQLTGQPYEKVIPEDARGAAHGFVFESVQNPGVTRRWESRMLRRDGSILHVKETIRASKDEDGILRTQIICEDITETQHLVEQLAFEATHDHLTLLLNRWEFERRLRQSLKNAADGRRYVLFYLDLDQFELVNDSCGHAAGDQMLRQFAEMMQGRFGQRGALARLGGD